jgi:peroxisomal membrane protein 2
MHRFRQFASRFFSTSTPKNPNASLWEKYNYHLVENPVITKSITGGVIAFTADVLCQTYFPLPKDAKKPWKERMNWKRALNFTIINTFIVPGLSHYWYGFLSTKIVGNTMFAAVKRVAIDQSIFAPCIIPVFLGGMLILDGKPEQVVPKLKADWWDTMLANYSLWIPAQLINFRFVPPHYRVLWANMVGFFWNIYLSNAAAKAPSGQEEEEPEEIVILEGKEY